MYDIVGDIHGYADKLIQLLVKLGYKQKGKVWSHPSRILISIGDLVDRGPQQREVIDILKPMTEGGNAIVLMGNHEFNAVSWALQDENGEFLRPHTDKNYAQHRVFLEQAIPGSPWHKDTIAWFMSLPLLHETDDLRCIHAAWDKTNVCFLKQHLSEKFTLNAEQWLVANEPSHPLYDAIEYCLKGPEVKLPDNHFFYDGGGHKRTKMRLKWWKVDTNSTYRDSALSVPDPSKLPSKKLPPELFTQDDLNTPIFFGHYWMTGEPSLISDNTACLDWSVAKKDGLLAAYRFDGEQILEQDKLVWV